MLQLTVGGRRKPHPANYRGCTQAKELQKKESWRTPNTTMRRVFSSALTTADVSFAAALRGTREQQKRPQARKVPVAVPTAAEILWVTAAVQQQETHSVQAPHVNSQPLDNTLRVVIVVQQIMRAQWCCVTRGQISGHYQNCLKSHEAK
jgi:hypothetical protein